jgi:hypothetical protein
MYAILAIVETYCPGINHDVIISLQIDLLDGVLRFQIGVVIVAFVF